MQHFHSVYERILKAGFDVDFYEVKHLSYVFFLRAIAENATKIARSYSYLHFWKKREGSRVSLVPMMMRQCECCKLWQPSTTPIPLIRKLAASTTCRARG